MNYPENDRVRYVPFTLELKHAALHDRAQFAQLLGVEVPPAWPGPDLAEALPILLARMEQQPDAQVWDGLIIHKQDHLLIGDMGFLGGPDETGAIEIGYSLIPAYRGHGYITNLARHLILWAFSQSGVKKITAQCLADNHPSIRVLERLGMRCTGQEGDLLQWQCPP